MTNKPMLSVEQELRGAISQALSAIRRIYQAGHEGITAAGGECDQSGVMFEGDPTVRELRALLDKPIPFPGYPPVPDDRKLPSAQHQGEPVAWSYCPECGCEELHHEEGDHKQCKNCHQEWFSDINYSEVVRGNLQKLKAEQPAPVAVVMPERKPQDLSRDDQPVADCFEEVGYNKALADVARLNGAKP